MQKIYTIYHNPRWGKSRRSVQILKENKLDFSVFEYLKSPISKQDLRNISKSLNLRPAKFIRKNEKIYKELNIENYLNDDDRLYGLIIKYPILMERPIIIQNNNKAVIGRPPENILTLL